MKHNATIARYNLHRMPTALLIVSLIVFIAGCGSSTDCSVAKALDISPPTATADHAASPPGNQVSFIASDARPASFCPLTPGPIRMDVKWSVSDPVNVTIGNTLNVDFGVATCKNATAGPITVNATGTNTRGATITGTAALTCN